MQPPATAPSRPLDYFASVASPRVASCRTPRGGWLRVGWLRPGGLRRCPAAGWLRTPSIALRTLASSTSASWPRSRLTSVWLTGATRPAARVPAIVRSGRLPRSGLRLLEVVGELALERAADLRRRRRPSARSAGVDVLGQERRRQRFLLAARTRPADAAGHLARAADCQESRAGSEAGGPGRVAPDLGLDVDGRPAGLPRGGRAPTREWPRAAATTSARAASASVTTRSSPSSSRP